MVRLIGEKLNEWETDQNVSVVVIKGAGPKGLCAGGDIKALYEARSSKQALQEAECFFETEYEVDMVVHRFPKPIIACLDGIVMGRRRPDIRGQPPDCHGEDKMGDA